MPKKARTIFTACVVLDKLEMLIEDIAANDIRFPRAFEAFDEHRAVISDVQRQGWETHWYNFRMAVSRKDRPKAILHLARLRKIVRPVANDQPHEVGQRVYVERYEHGWDIGEGTVQNRRQTQDGIWVYSVRLDRDGCDIPVTHTNDARAIW